VESESEEGGVKPPLHSDTEFGRPFDESQGRQELL